MSDSTIHIGENSPEQVAFKLLQIVMKAEKRTELPQLVGDAGRTLADRQYILDTYAECALAVRQPHRRSERD